MRVTIIILAFLCIDCQEKPNYDTYIKIIDKQQSKIDSLQALYENCDMQAEIMAEALE